MCLCIPGPRVTIAKQDIWTEPAENSKQEKLGVVKEVMPMQRGEQERIWDGNKRVVA